MTDYICSVLLDIDNNNNNNNNNINTLRVGVHWKRQKADNNLHKLLRTWTTLMTVLLANTPTQAESHLYSQEQAAGGIGLHVNADKMENVL